MNLRGLVFVLAPSMAHAQAIARAPTETIATQSAKRGWNDGFGAEFGYGFARADGVPDAWAIRLQYHSMPFLAEPDRVGPLMDIGYGYEFWRGGHGTWGFDMPIELQLGMRASGFRIEGGLGFDAFLVDQVHGDTGVGFFAPLASMTAGLDTGGVTLLADARVTQRWQFGADDHMQWMFTVGLGFLQEPRKP